MSEEIDLTPEDDQLLTEIWLELGREERKRIKAYGPLMAKLLAKLRVLDAEAIPLHSGYPVGLWWYARHRRRDEDKPKNCRNEEDWSRRLQELLNEENVSTETERPYPLPPRRRCDLVIQWPRLGEVWLEVKGAWRHNDSKGSARNGAYKKHLRAAGKDLDKLCSLEGSTAQHIGLLFVGFDTADDPISEDDVELIEATPRRAGWIKLYQSWLDPYRPRGRVRIWLWMNDAHYTPDIFDHVRVR